MLTWVLVITPFVLIYLYLRRVNQHWVNKNVPYVRPWLFFGNFGSFALRQESIADMVQNAYNAYEDARYIGIHQFLVPTLMLKDVNLIKQIGIKEFDHFVDHRSFISDEMDPLFGKNLFMLRGEKWRNMRSTLSPAFTGSKMRSMFILMSDCAKQFADYFTEIVNPNEPVTFEMKDLFTRYANDVIATTAFGIQCDSMREKTNEFYLMGKDATNFDGLKSLKFFGYNISPAFMKLFKVQVFSEKTSNFFRNIIQNNIKTREEQGIVRPDLIHLLMEARKGKLKHEDNKSKDEGAGFATVEESHIGKQTDIQQEILSDDDITAQALIFFFAGFDTISTALCHLVYELALNEDVQEKLQNEIDITLDECKGKISYEAIIRMKYLDMVLSEGLRKWPPGPAIDRVCVDSFTIKPERPGETPVILNKEDPIWIPIYGLHRDPKHFPNPEKFDPERFSDENKGNIDLNAYLPFGVGPRNCIGSRFALLEAKTLLFHMLSKYSFVIVEKSEIPIKISRTQFNMNAANGFWLGMKSRTKQVC